MAEWLYEEGIGENRAILVESGDIVEALVEWPGGIGSGAVVDARLTSILVPGRRAVVALGNGQEALLEPLPAALTEGQGARVEVLREAVPEPGRVKLARVRVTDAALREGPTLFDRLALSSDRVSRIRPTDADRFEQAGWSELVNEASSGDIAFQGGALRMSLTPAMTLFDVDGYLDPEALAMAGAGAAGRAIRRFAISGSIGLDLPTLPSRAARQAAAAALDAVLPQPFERTAVNGFGFLQIVRKRERASLPELLQFDSAGGAARALLRLAERTGGAGERTIRAAPAVIQAIREDWRRELERRIGAPVALRPDPALAISAGHVQAANP